MIATGQRLVVFGKPRLRGKRLCMEHPEFEVIENDDEISVHFRRITPIYPATEGLSQRVFRAMIFHALENLDPGSVPTLLPKNANLGTREHALHEIQFPTTTVQCEAAREHLVFAEFFAMQLLIGSRRAEATSRTGQIHSASGELLEKFLRGLPFDLTTAQERVIEELRRDLASTHPMNRLLQGDVGSGKTVVAIAAMLLAVESGSQAALMAPTQILAEQHYAVLCNWLDPLGIRIALRTGARQEDNAPLPLFARGESESLGSAGYQPAVSGSLPDTTPSGISEPQYHRRLPHFERPWSKYAITFSTRNRRILPEATRDGVLESIRRRNGRRYELFGACVMPNHVHLLIEPMVERQNESGNSIFFSLSKILHSIKSFTANRINKIEKVNEPVWESESFDRMIRSESDLQEKFEYITRNPWNAGIAKPTEDYRWVWYPRARREEFAAGCRERQAGSLRSPAETAGNE